jgi:anti-anti-sigma factor
VIAVDLSVLTFCDSSGLNPLLSARMHAQQRAVPLRLAAPSPVVLRILQVTGADTVLPIHDRIDQARA